MPVLVFAQEGRCALSEAGVFALSHGPGTQSRD